jgi:hypothetical protein
LAIIPKHWRQMVRARAIGVMLVSLVIAGCSNSSTGPGGTNEQPYPDIDGLVAYYEFDGNLENEASDAHHGTGSRALTYTTDRHGHADSAVHVDTSDEILVPDDPELDITGGITLAVWVRPEASDRAYAAVIDKKYTEAYSFGIYGGIADPDTVYMISYVSDNPDGTPTLVPMGTGAWSHIAFTFEDSTGKGRYYFNGAVVDSSTRSVLLGTSDEDLRIGGSFRTDDYKGAIDQVAVFDRALTPAEVAVLFAFE